MMQVAVCTKSQEEFEWFSGILCHYGEEYGEKLQAVWFDSRELMTRAHLAKKFPLLVLAFDDIDNQETAVVVREMSEEGEIIWIGDDGRFGVSSYRLRVRDFLLRPVAEEAFRSALDWCLCRRITKS